MAALFPAQAGAGVVPACLVKVRSADVLNLAADVDVLAGVAGPVLGLGEALVLLLPRTVAVPAGGAADLMGLAIDSDLVGEEDLAIAEAGGAAANLNAGLIVQAKLRGAAAAEIHEYALAVFEAQAGNGARTLAEIGPEVLATDGFDLAADGVLAAMGLRLLAGLGAPALLLLAGAGLGLPALLIAGLAVVEAGAIVVEVAGVDAVVRFPFPGVGIPIVVPAAVIGGVVVV